MAFRILFVEDEPADVELMLITLRAAGLEPQWKRVATEAQLRAALDDGEWQVTLVDYTLPGFAGPRALQVLREAAPDLPAITVCGAISEETAVATMIAGAVDYVLKDNLTRLAPAVERAIETEELRRERRQAAAQARQSQFAVEHSSQAILYIGEDGALLYVNQAAERLGGVPSAEAVGRTIWDWSPAVDETLWADLWQTAGEHPVVDFETPFTLPDGEVRILSATLDRLKHDDNTFMICYARDITERRHTEEALRRSEGRYARAQAVGRVGNWEYDPQTTEFWGSAEARRIYGFDPERSTFSTDEVEGCTPERERVHQALVDLIQDGKEFDLEYEIYPKDSAAPKTIWSLAEVQRDERGAPLIVAGTVQDITARKRAEAALVQSERRFAKFAEQMPGRLWIRDRDLRYLYLNPQLAADLGGAESDFLGKTPEDLWSADAAANARHLCERALGGEVVDIMERWPDQPGSGCYRSLVFALPGEGEAPMIGGLMFDVTEQLAAQEEVSRQAEQLRRTVEGAVRAMSQVVETRDPYTAGHERRVSELAVAIAASMGMAAEQIDGLRLAALIHDIGKISIPAEILAKPGRLSDIEFNLIKQHAQAGYDILAAIEFNWPLALMILQHHERLDGTGYPAGLDAAHILKEAKILAVADVVEAMSSHRPYRPALGIEPALAEVRANAGLKYDGEVAAACERVFGAGFAFSS